MTGDFSSESWKTEGSEKTFSSAEQKELSSAKPRSAKISFGNHEKNKDTFR